MLPHSRLPDSPPALGERIELSGDHTKKLNKIVAELSEALDGMPVVLSQQGDVVAYAGLAEDAAAERIARLANRMWRDGENHLAREVVRFEEETVEKTDETTNLMLYSRHINGALVLSISWHIALSLTQIRAEVGDVRQDLLKLLS
jgi:hypothetical protein